MSTCRAAGDVALRIRRGRGRMASMQAAPAATTCARRSMPQRVVSEGDRAVEAGVVGEVDALRTAPAEETPYPIASARERGRRRGRGHAARALYARARRVQL